MSTLVKLNRLLELWKLWDETPKHQRFGQFVCNQLNITNDELFYEEDNFTAFDKLLKTI